MLEQICKAEEAAKGFTFEQFSNDPIRFAAISYFTMIIDEAAYMLTKEFLNCCRNATYPNLYTYNQNISHIHKMDLTLYNTLKIKHLPPPPPHTHHLNKHVNCGKWAIFTRVNDSSIVPFLQLISCLILPSAIGFMADVDFLPFPNAIYAHKSSWIAENSIKRVGSIKQYQQNGVQKRHLATC